MVFQSRSASTRRRRIALSRQGTYDQDAGPESSEDVEPVFSVHLRRGELALAFFTTITTFSSPRVVTLDELRIESSFPLDDATRRFCQERA